MISRVAHRRAASLPPAGQRGQQRKREHDQIEQNRRVCRGVGDRQRGARCDHPPGSLSPVPGPDHAPGGQRDQHHAEGVVGRERPQMQRRAQYSEQRGSEQRSPPPIQPASGPPQQSSRSEHEQQRQDPGRGQPAKAVGQRAQGRVDHRRPREVLRERGDRCAVQPVRPLQMPGPQGHGLIVECRVRPDQPHRQRRLHGKHHHQQQRAGDPQPELAFPTPRPGPASHRHCHVRRRRTPLSPG